MKYLFILTFLLSLLVTPKQSTAQVPSNDNCSGAIVITTSNNCVSINGDISGATDSGIPVSQNCSQSNPNDDVWYKFIATCTHMAIQITGSDSLNPVLEVFSGSCDSLTSILCEEQGIPTKDLAGGTIFGSITYVEGQTYYIRIYNKNGGQPASTTFTICVFNTYPANDNYSGEFTLYPNGSTVCVNGDVCGATQSYNSCIGTNPDYDVWYSFLTLPIQDKYTISVVGSSGFDPVFQVCYGRVQGPCWCVNANGNGDTATISLTGLETGHYYHMRVWDYSGNPSTTSFTLCVTDSLYTNISEVNGLQLHSTISPNPFSTQTVLQVVYPLTNATLTVNNCFGQTVKLIQNISGQTITLNRDNLPSGLYFLHLTQGNNTFTTDKLLITDN